MIPTVLVGLSTTGGAFTFESGRRPDPVYAALLPKDGSVLFAHEGLVPTSFLPWDDKERYVLPSGDFMMYVDEVEEGFDLLQMQLSPVDVRRHLLEQRQARQQEQQAHPEEDLLVQRIIRSFVSSTGSASGRSLPEQVYDAMRVILGSPLAEYNSRFSFHALFQDGIIPPNVDVYSVWLGDSHGRQGMPQGDMVNLVIDCHLAAKTGCSLLTNPVTAELLPVAERYLGCIRKGDIVGYFCGTQ